MISDVADKDWHGRIEKMKEGITDQLKRTEYGMKKNKITDAEGAEIITRAQDIIDKIDEIAKNTGSHSGGHKGSGGGGFGSGFGGGRGKHHSDSETSDDSNQSGQLKDFLELRQIIDEYYSNTVTASAATVPVTGTAAPEGINNFGTPVPGPR